MPSTTETALVVLVPETNPVIGPVRASLDRAAGWGVPPHVTIMYPFLPPERINDEVLQTVGEIVRTVPSFEVDFTRVEWFGDKIVWLAPEPDWPFRELTATIWQRFPETPPYAGVYTGVVPHLTFGHEHPKPVLTEAAEAVSKHLPIHASVRSVHLMSGVPEPDGWHIVHEFPLRGRVDATR